jgi:hypothetical protein
MKGPEKILVMLTDALAEIRATQLQYAIPELSFYTKAQHEFGKAVIPLRNPDCIGQEKIHRNPMQQKTKHFD